MKLQNFLTVLTLSILLLNCSIDDSIEHIAPTNSSHIMSSREPQSNLPMVSYIEDALVIEYNTGVTEPVRQALRQYYDVINFEVCKQCPDNRFEKWYFDPTIQIEPKKAVIDDDNDDEDDKIKRTDYDFNFYMPSIPSSFGGSPTDYSHFIKDANSGLTVAIIDTGIDVGLTSPKLYNASEESLEGLYSSWNFVNNTHNPFDNHFGKHGTVIAHYISKTLSAKNIDYQLLPVKAFNEYGMGTYFNVICATQFAAKRAQIINMSFGWYHDSYGDFEDSILQGILEDHNDKLFITSAGNLGVNNDELPHYPSGYFTHNVLSIAACKSDYSAAAHYSNFGLNSVDYYATESIYFMDMEYSGTSFAAPKALLQVAILFGAEIPDPDTIVNYINDVSTPYTFIIEKPVKQNRVIEL